MNSKLQSAKHAFAAKKYIECKQIILEIIESNEYDKNYKLYAKLGDISIGLNEYQTAKKYFQCSINEHPSNPNVLFKLARLLHEYLYEYNQAEILYEKSINLDPNNDQCLFHYGKLMEKQMNFIKAKQLYQQCLQINDNKACVNFHLATLLMQDEDYNNDKYIENLLKRAIEMQPKNLPCANYYFQFAIHSQKMKKLIQANDAYQMALKLSNNENKDILYQYANFLIHDIGDKENGAKYLEMASLLDVNITIGINHGYQTKMQSSYPKLASEYEIPTEKDFKLVIYEFESIISYWNLNVTVNENIEQLRYMTKQEIETAFGGTDRILRLSQHFDTILTASGDIQIIIVSYTSSKIVTEAMQRVKLYDYIYDIIELNNNGSKMDQLPILHINVR